ncbi:UDP-glycosyltransferase UGT5 [Stomoxys calcitrans]|uniref:UDP-glycosyltransferase UGT5 n=1 Tax=Stomoxys calcitrans TaxID=35570 RepID=UPI0027E305DF|nr:UDP-glycosyltransferase UGT5 [Stomoxys calcitrans]
MQNLKDLLLRGCGYLLLISITTSSMQCHGTHILAVLPSVWKSHYLFGYQMMQQIMERRNYSVTLISPYEGGGGGKVQAHVQDARFREIKVEGLLENWLEMGLTFDIDEMHGKSVMEHFTRLMYATTSNTDTLLQNPKVRELLQSQQKYDLLVVDLFLSDALLGLSFFYQIPTVVISPSGSNTWLNQRFGNPQNAALDPSNFLPYSKDMTLWQRNINTLMAMFEKLTYSFFHMISQQAVYTKHFEPLCQVAPWCNELPDHRDLTENLSLALINSHPVLQYPRSYLPNMLTVAGVHLATDGQELKLPAHLKEFIEEAQQGVVYISFGANIYDFPQEKIELFLDFIETLPEMRFIVKYDEEENLDMTSKVSDKVMVQNWWPQQAILAHDNVKLFITSGGFMSITESIYFLKPILAIPITPEQYVLVENLKIQGSAYILNYNDLTYDHILCGVNDTLNNPKYKESLKVLKSQLVNDLTGLTPIEKVLSSIDMTLETKGLNYLKTHSQHLNFWSSILMDVMLILLLGLLTILAIPFILTSCILRKSYQNHANLTTLKNQVRTRREIDDFLTKSLNNGDNETLKTVRRSSSNSDFQQKRKRLSSGCSHSNSCCYCSSVSSSAPGTPVTRESPSFSKSLETNDI